jgi:hypothetical protein
MIVGDLIRKNTLLRHDNKKLGEILWTIIRENKKLLDI